MSYLFAADTHLADAAWSGRPIMGDAYFALQQITDIAIARKVDGVVLAGDVLDKKRNNSAAIAALRKMAIKLKTNDIRFYAIEGQHDASEPSWIEIVPGGENIHDTLIDATPATLYGLSYQTPEMLRVLVPAVTEDAVVLVCHQMWAEHAPHGAEPDGSLVELIPAHIQVVVSGDIHAHLVKTFTTKAGHKVKFISPGSTCMQDIGESDEKKVVLLNDNLSHEIIGLKCRPCIKPRSIASAHDLDKLLRELPGLVTDAEEETTGWPETVRRPLLRIKYARELPETEDQVRELLGVRVHYFFDYLTQEGADDVPSYTGAAWKGRAREILLQCLDEEFEGQTDTQAYRLARELLDTDSEHAKEAINRWYQDLCTSTTPPSSTSDPTADSSSAPPTTRSREARSASSAPTAAASRR